MQSIQRTGNGISETYNKVESRHNTFARLVGGNHPIIFKILVFFAVGTESSGCQTWHYTYANNKTICDACLQSNK
ncbi:hypothetical protein HZS_4513 [Henneguya salminicola]|nr:hypothetical protein HZS_4513 [Henneguya salminicola]